MSGKVFADLRAKFESKNDTSPLTRGRSPAGQENVKGSGRKIRTSFVSVERSGQMSPSIDQRESMGSNDDQTSVTEGAKDPKSGMHAEDSEMPKTNGIAVNSEKQDESQDLPNEQASPGVEKKLGNGSLEMEEATKTNAINPDKPNTAGEDDASPMLPSDPKDEGAVSGGAALAPKGESLGTLLKGSDFVEDGGSLKESSPQKSPKKNNAQANPSTPVKKTRASPKSTPAKAGGTPKVNGSPKLKSTPSRPSTTSKSQASSAAKSLESFPSVKKNTDTPTGETTAASPTASKPSFKQPVEKVPSPKKFTPKQQTQAGDVPKPGEKERPKAAIAEPGRLSTSKEATQPTAPASSKPNGAVSTATSKKSGPRSPVTVKPKPRSPTRPVRLPGAATASTAASSAKTGSTAPPRPESRAGTANPSKASTLNKAVKGSRPSTANIRSKAPRSSLPAPTTEQKPKPRPRTSIASTKAPGNDFLSRMMRPTTSSASKTHEKVDQKTPPKKRISLRPKRISDNSGEKAESKAVEAGTGLKEQATEKDGKAVNHIESGNHQEDAVTVPTKESSTEEIPESNGDKLTSSNEVTVAAS